MTMLCVWWTAAKMLALCCARGLVLSSDTELHVVSWVPGFFTNKWKVPVENAKALAVWILFLIENVSQRNSNLRKH